MTITHNRDHSQLLDSWFMAESTARAVKAHLDYVRVTTGVNPRDDLVEFYQTTRQVATLIREHITDLIVHGYLYRAEGDKSNGNT